MKTVAFPGTSPDAVDLVSAAACGPRFSVELSKLDIDLLFSILQRSSIAKSSCSQLTISVLQQVRWRLSGRGRKAPLTITMPAAHWFLLLQSLSCRIWYQNVPTPNILRVRDIYTQIEQAAFAWLGRRRSEMDDDTDVEWMELNCEGKDDTNNDACVHHPQCHLPIS